MKAMRLTVLRLLALTIWVWAAVGAAAESPDRAAVASAHPLASDAGIEILNRGGNAFDAAVAVSAALSVVEPYGSGLGGGGFYLLHRASDGRDIVIDGRETAPSAAHEDMYLDASGEPIPGASRNGPLAAGIPGLPAALVHLAENYGRLPLAESLQPAIRYAEEGFPAYEWHLSRLARRGPTLSDAARDVFVPGGEVPGVDSPIRQADLGATLRALADGGRDGFYRGSVARKLVEGVRRDGGIWSAEDLAVGRDGGPGHETGHGLERRRARLHAEAAGWSDERLREPVARAERFDHERAIAHRRRSALGDAPLDLGYVPARIEILRAEGHKVTLAIRRARQDHVVRI